jgi:hypothetical protein
MNRRPVNVAGLRALNRLNTSPIASSRALPNSVNDFRDAEVEHLLARAAAAVDRLARSDLLQLDVACIVEPVERDAEIATLGMHVVDIDNGGGVELVRSAD